MHLPDNPTLQFLVLHGYWFAVPVMIVEGPIATIVMAFFASFGFFNPFVVLACSFFSDTISDTVYYAIGYFHGPRFAGRFGRLFKLTPKTLASVERFYRNHGGKSVFLAKILTGVVPPVFIVAGWSKMNLKKFYGFSSLGGVLWSSGLVALGYYFGRQVNGRFDRLGETFGVTGSIIFSLLVLFVIYKLYFSKILRKRLQLFFNSN
jgi:membrane protein DedA with SNARE-associated domain